MSDPSGSDSSLSILSSLLSPFQRSGEAFDYPSTDDDRSAEESDHMSSTPDLPLPPSPPSPPSISIMSGPFRIGGIKTFGKDAIRFSGGGMHKKLPVPVSALAYRPEHDLRSMMRVEEHCKTPLEEAKRIDDTTDCPVTFSRWLNDIERAMTDNGLDSVVYVLVPDDTHDLSQMNSDQPATILHSSELNVFRHWGTLTQEHIDTWDTAILESTDPMDIQNDKFACKFLHDSVGPTIQDQLDRDLPIQCSGAKMLYYIVQIIQSTSATTGRDLIHELETIKLTAEAGLNVANVKKKIHDICTKLTGLGAEYLPFDLPLMVVRCLSDSQIPAFDLEMLQIESALDKNLKAHTWQQVLSCALSKYNTLKNSKRWPPLETAKDSKTAATGFAVQLQEMQKTMNQIQSAQGFRDSNSTYQKRDLSDVECHYCHQKGHYKSDCPKLQQSTGSSPPDGGSGEGAKEKHWTKIPPNEGDSESKSVTVDGTQVLAKFCKQCRRWRHGDKAHTTSQHIKRSDNGNGNQTTQISGSGAQGNSAHVPNNIFSYGLTGMTGIVPISRESTWHDRALTEHDFLQELYNTHSENAITWDSDYTPPSDWTLVRPGEGTPLKNAKMSDSEEKDPKVRAGRRRDLKSR
jgi:hypothetical protein